MIAAADCARANAAISAGHRYLPGAVLKQFEYDPADNLVGKLEQRPGGQHSRVAALRCNRPIIASQDNFAARHETYSYDAAANLLDGPQAGAGLVVHNKLLTYQDKRYRYDGFGPHGREAKCPTRRPAIRLSTLNIA